MWEHLHEIQKLCEAFMVDLHGRVQTVQGNAAGAS